MIRATRLAHAAEAADFKVGRQRSLRRQAVAELLVLPFELRYHIEVVAPYGHTTCMVAVSPNPDFMERTYMRISARNQIKGTILDVTKGATTSHIRLDIGGGQVVTSSITNEAVDELGLKAGGNATVVIKASDVMIAVD